MYDFSTILTAVSDFTDAALAIVDPSTLIGGAIAVGIGATLVVGVAARLMSLARRAR